MLPINWTVEMLVASSPLRGSTAEQGALSKEFCSKASKKPRILLDLRAGVLRKRRRFERILLNIETEDVAKNAY